jgi:ABC-type nickel/cobalt efflux system permease component RcnA
MMHKSLILKLSMIVSVMVLSATLYGQDPVQHDAAVQQEQAKNSVLKNSLLLLLLGGAILAGLAYKRSRKQCGTYCNDDHKRSDVKDTHHKHQEERHHAHHTGEVNSNEPDISNDESGDILDTDTDHRKAPRRGRKKKDDTL